MLAMFASPLARIAVVAGVIITGLWFVYREGRKNGEASVRAEIAAENKRRLDRAILADDDAKRCAADPSCRLQSDGFRRD
jgi:hypothetical protein